MPPSARLSKQKTSLVEGWSFALVPLKIQTGKFPYTAMWLVYILIRSTMPWCWLLCTAMNQNYHI
jgi:hypothetical protein